MSDFFSNLGGFRKPDVRMNQGPLPSVAGGPAGTDGSIDGRINANASLLDGITPYAYGESARAGSDSNYQQVPQDQSHKTPITSTWTADFLTREGEGRQAIGDWLRDKTVTVEDTKKSSSDECGCFHM